MPGYGENTDGTSVRVRVSVVVFFFSMFCNVPLKVHGQACTVQNCRPPNCFCKGGDIPGGLPIANTPQLVMLTFDDAVNQAFFPLYESLYRNKLNPDGCPVRGTFYVCHDYSNYQMIQSLYNQGHEIASHSISHRLPSSWWSWATPAEWSAEIEGQREILSSWANIPKSEIRGMRAPYLSVGGDAQFQMISSLLNDNFIYDSSVVSRVHSQSAFISPTWPYTMDYPPSDECLIPPCPTQSYPGVWEIPLVSTQTQTGQWCSMEDECTPGMTEDEVYNYFLSNLDRHYTSSRAPFGIFLHGPYLENPGHFRALDRFISDVTQRGDVYFVTAWQVIQWMRNPTGLGQLGSFFCPIRTNAAQCTADQANFCLFDGAASLVNRKKRSTRFMFEDLRAEGQTLGEQIAGNQTFGNQTTGNQTFTNQTTGSQTVGNQTTGNQATGNQTQGNQTVGNQTTGNQTDGNQTQGNQTIGNQATGNQTIGNQTTGNQTIGNQTTGNQTFASLLMGELVLENQVFGNQTIDNQTVTNQTLGNQTEFGSQIAGNQSFGNQTFGNQTNGNQTFGNQTTGNQTFVNQTGGNQTVTNLIDAGLTFAEFRDPKFDIKYLGSSRNLKRRSPSRQYQLRHKRQTYNGWHNMYTCNPCPQSYPWLGNSDGF